MGPAEVRQYCNADKSARGAGGQGPAAGGDAGPTPHVSCGPWALHMSARAYHRILKLARTIADLVGSNGSEGSATIQTPHLAEAIQYRPRRQF